jgi:hypothetical protein
MISINKVLTLYAIRDANFLRSLAASRESGKQRHGRREPEPTGPLGPSERSRPAADATREVVERWLPCG